ncbi:penicillin-binding protein 1A [Brevundimonas sp. PAMC22021]|nr:penicillin-binding protein 1A [Brevundimonas sp. PAMC22021]QYF88272.1 penicillin-binding protein 1A [Brevundimonas sp. PAMC22021]
MALLGAVALAGLVVAVYAAWLFYDLPDASELADYRPPTATRVYAGDGTLIGEFSDERRIYVSYDQIPDTVRHAFLAAEDRNFFHHGGIDVGGIGRASLKNVANLARGRRLEGGSTITQQVAKNVLLTNESSLNRKLKEAILASRLEATLSKEQVLELYLNEIFLGYRSFGIASAAYNYFGKSLQQLTPDEAAFLAALPKGPNNYHPKRHPGAAKGRRDWVLGEMEQSGWITTAELQQARARPLNTRDAPQRAAYRDADFFVEEARRQAAANPDFGDQLRAGGFYMRTTLDPTLQTAARSALMQGLENYDRRHGWRGAWGATDFEDGWQARALAEQKIPPERRAWEVAAVESVSGNNVRVRTAREDRSGSLLAADAAWANANRPLKRGDLIHVERSGGQYALKQIPRVNGAMVAIEPQSGRVLAMVGGYSYALSSFNRATQAERQPGSAFKPFVYATALEGDYTPASIVLDAPISFAGGPNGQRWTPENYSREYYGPQTLRRGLELSRNVMTVRLAQAVGMKKIVDQSARMGIPGLTPNLSVSLGAGEVTPYQLTAAYAAFVNGGRRITPYLIDYVQDRDGETIFRADDRRCGDCGRGFSGQESPKLDPRGAQVIDPITAYQMSSMLEGVVQRGTAASARGLGRWVGGKTGTTNEYRSAWFVGFTTDIVVGVFIGFDDNRPLGNGETGTTAAVPVFIDFMQTALKERPARPFVRPRNAIFRPVNGIEEAFRPGTERRAPPVRAPVRAPVPPQGPQNYNDVIRRETEAATSAPPPSAPPPPKREPAEDLSGLY